jgi:predicted transcriptional regulator
MAEHADASTLNVQPRQRRMIYEDLAKAPSGRSVKELLRNGDIPESDLRETLRKLDSAGLAQRIKGTWRAIPLEGADAASTSGQETGVGDTLDA